MRFTRRRTADAGGMRLLWIAIAAGICRRRSVIGLSLPEAATL
jgi:hypothetical protein